MILLTTSNVNLIKRVVSLFMLSFNYYSLKTWFRVTVVISCVLEITLLDSNNNPFDPIEADCVASPVIQLGGFWR